MSYHHILNGNYLIRDRRGSFKGKHMHMILMASRTVHDFIVFV